LARAGAPVVVPLWGRLEFRMIAALAVLGATSVLVALYLMRLTAEVFDARVDAALTRAASIADAVEPFQRELVDATALAHRQRARAIAADWALRLAADVPPAVALAQALERDGVALEARLAGPNPLVVQRPSASPSALAEPPAMAGPTRYEVAVPLDDAGADSLIVTLPIDPVIDARYQEFGRLKREIGLEREAQPGIERAVARGIGIVGGVVLLLSWIAGFVLARATTRKVGQLSRAMARVAAGDLTQRADEAGNDELAQLAAAFNRMLDELDTAQRKLAYLQRIGAWQEMARRIAHEIKNPLTPIQLAVQQVRDKDPGLDPAFSRLLRASVEIVEDEVEALRRMVASFSQFARVPEVRREPVAVARILREFERAYGHLGGDSPGDAPGSDEGAALRVEPADPALQVDGDRQLLKQVLVNLVENSVLSARDAGRGGCRVEVTAAAAEPSHVELRVDDDGPGIPGERREAVFEPYVTTRAHGTGLGLAIVKKIVLDHGGEVRIEDSPLGGAAVIVRLPRAPRSSAGASG
jgi:nitrogen fixation/metabolism regulation signal transduction histidine kinase